MVGFFSAKLRVMMRFATWRFDSQRSHSRSDHQFKLQRVENLDFWSSQKHGEKWPNICATVLMCIEKTNLDHLPK